MYVNGEFAVAGGAAVGIDGHVVYARSKCLESKKSVLLTVPPSKGPGSPSA